MVIAIQFVTHTEKNTSDTVLATLYYRKNSTNSKHPYKLFRRTEFNNTKISQYITPRNMNQNFKGNKQNVDNIRLNKHITNFKRREYKCFKCNQPGHVVNNCPYSYKDLAEMEEKGQLRNNSSDIDHLNSKMEEGKLPQ